MTDHQRDERRAAFSADDCVEDAQDLRYSGVKIDAVAHAAHEIDYREVQVTLEPYGILAEQGAVQVHLVLPCTGSRKGHVERLANGGAALHVSQSEDLFRLVDALTLVLRRAVAIGMIPARAVAPEAAAEAVLEAEPGDADRYLPPPRRAQAPPWRDAE